ncbi:hypothetical protein B0H65DRAFT_455110 [Neurospora tetraspora]|uniref:Secreted protein n=1 Tax=Neurospora tetraspora TaxID=94610 RepID=A0AAE0JJM7_9PEZI|nr:hypothetical protein B0H65DRAFT_455110 [Neurospora tetraspora]
MTRTIHFAALLLHSLSPSPLFHPMPHSSCSCIQSIKHFSIGDLHLSSRYTCWADAVGARSRLTSHSITHRCIGRVAIACIAYLIKPLG